MGSTKDVEEQYDRIYRYCFYRIGQKETAEDITQETFLKFYQTDAYQTSGNPLKVMYTIARNLCINEWKRKKASVSLDETYEEAIPELDLSDKRDFAEELINGMYLKESVGKLGEEEQEILFLRFVNEEDFGVIASLLGLSRFAVHRRYKKALETLGKELSLK